MIMAKKRTSTLQTLIERGFKAVADDIADLRRRLEDTERTAEDLPHREKYLLLVIDFLRGLLDLHEQLVDEVERVFPAPRRKRSTPANPKTSRTCRRELSDPC